MSEKTRVKQISLRGGARQTDSAGLRVARGVDYKGQRPRDDLYILIQDLPSPGGVRPPYDRLVEVISQTFYSMSGSVTRALRAALLAANELLFEANLRAGSEHLVLLGLNCVAVRDDDEAFIAHLGPALTLVRQRDALTRFPDDSIWFEQAPPDALDVGLEPPAGLRRDLEPDLFHVTLNEGDLLLMADSALARLVAPDLLAATLSGEDVAAALEAHLGTHDPDLMLVERLPEASVEDESRRPSALWPQQRVAAASVRSKEPVAVPDIQEEPSVGENGHRGEEQPSESLSLEEAVVRSDGPPPRVAEPVEPPFLHPRDERPPVSGDVVADVSADDVDDEWDESDIDEWDEQDAVLDVAYDDRDDVPYDGGRPARAAVAVGDVLERVRQGVPTLQADLIDLGHHMRQRAGRARVETEEFLIRVLPDRLPERPVMHQESEQTVSLSGRALIAVAFVIPLVMLFLVVMTRVQYDRARSGQFDSLQALAQARFDSAMQIENELHQREALYEALISVEEGLAINPSDETLTTLQRRILHRLDEVEGVERLYHFWKLTEVEDDIVSPTDSSRIVIHDNAIYILNRGSGRIYRFLLNEVGDALQTVDASPVLVEKGSPVRGVPVGDLVDITWMEAGGARTLSTFVALERTGTLLAYDPQQGLDPLPVADSDTWLKPQAIGGYYGNFYVLDPLLSRILRYEPQDNAYTTSPGDYLVPETDVDLTGAVDMAIDGNIYVLFADGHIVKLYEGQPKPFTMSGLPGAMSSPTTITVSGAQEPDAYGHIYVTDTGNERIIQFDKEGNYVRQFRARPDENYFKDLRAVYVDEDHGRMFVLSGRTLWLTNISSPES